MTDEGATTPVSVAGKKRPKSSVAEDFECAVCYDLLLDPVVAPCGHDMCSHCYQRWSSANGAVALCPLCRCTLPSNLAVCLRLKKTIERFHPEASQRRRQEVASQREAQPKVDPSPDPELPQQQLPTYPPGLVAQWTAFLPQQQHSFFSNMVAAQYMQRQHLSPVPPAPEPPASSEYEAAEASSSPPTLATCDGNLLYSIMPCWTNFTGSSILGSTDPSINVPPPPPRQAQKSTWQTAADGAIRLETARAIISALQARGWHQTLGSKLADAVRFLELFLYRTAASRDCYTNASDLEARIVVAVQQRAAAACARRARLEAGAGSQAVQQRGAEALRC